METISEKKVIFLGCPLDCDEKADAIEEKLSGEWIPGESDDPFDMVMEMIRGEVSPELWEDMGSVNVPGWLRPKPSGADRSKIVVDEFVAFIDQDGCRKAAAELEDIVSKRILPNIPCMIAVDHALTGGPFRALANHYGRENISLIILDSHTDAISMAALAGAIQYDMDNNRDSLYSRDDPFLYNRTDSYNASSFVYHLLNEEAVMPENLFILGVSDYPQKHAFRIKDPRVAQYVGTYTGMKRKRVKIITKKELLTGPSKLKNVLRQIRTPYIYISIDMDIGSRNAVEGVRFRDWKGLNEKQIYRIADSLHGLGERGVQLVGLDITEINPRRAGQLFPSGEDRTCRIAANLIKKIAF